VWKGGANKGHLQLRVSSNEVLPAKSVSRWERWLELGEVEWNPLIWQTPRIESADEFPSTRHMEAQWDDAQVSVRSHEAAWTCLTFGTVG
jgi:hypothetical protein